MVPAAHSTKACVHGPDQSCSQEGRACLLQVEHNVDQMLQHYSSEGWLTYQEPAAPLSRQTSVRVRPPALDSSLHKGQPGCTACCLLSYLVMCLGAISTASRWSKSLLGAAGAAGRAELALPSECLAVAHVCGWCWLLMGVMRLQSQAGSATRDAGEAPIEAQLLTDTERLRNQFNFNERATQVGVTQYAAVPQCMCAQRSGDCCHGLAVDRAEAAACSNVPG